LALNREICLSVILQYIDQFREYNNLVCRLHLPL